MGKVGIIWLWKYVIGYCYNNLFNLLRWFYSKEVVVFNFFNFILRGLFRKLGIIGFNFCEVFYIVDCF